MPSVVADLLRQSLEHLAAPAFVLHRSSATTLTVLLANAAARVAGAAEGTAADDAVRCALAPPLVDRTELVQACAAGRATLRRWTNAAGLTVTARATPLTSEGLVQITWSGHTPQETRLPHHLLLREQHELHDWLARTPLTRSSLLSVIRSLLERICALHGTERASVWLFSEDGRQLRSIDLFVRSRNSHETEPPMDAETYGIGFETLRRSLYVDVHDTENDPRAQVYLERYLRPNGITSMLDAAIRFGGRCYGTLCLEHVGQRHVWQPHEIDFACTIASYLATAMESLARSEAEGQVRERENFLRAVIDGSPIGIQIYAPDGMSRRLNQAMCRLIGLPSLEYSVGRYNILLDPLSQQNGFADAFRHALAGRATQIECHELDLTGPEFDGEPVRRERFWIESVYFPVFGQGNDVEAVVVFSWEVTERVRAAKEKEQLEQQLRQSQKIEAVGMLAGGVAHDFNNILTAVLGFTEALRLAEQHEHDELVDQIRRAAMRGAALTRQLLAFGRVTMTRVEVFDACAVLTEMFPMVRRLVEANISVSLHCADNAPILADRSQFQQVVLNLVVNARDATLHGGSINVHLDRVTGEDQRPWMRLIVRDTGCGMDRETQARLFEPFFTTKAPGQGTGLGLSTVLGIVQSSQGRITVDSTAGMGSAFTVHLPIAPSAPTATAPRSPELHSRNRETILVVEDDDDNRKLAARILEHYGYEVHAAASGEHALRMVTDLPHIDVLFTDVVMPGMGGRLLAEQLQVARPGIHVVFTSGYTTDDVLRFGIEKDMVAFLPKPYSATELANAIRAALRD
ncbi:MAG: response regulator [Planctomycetota bacterium]